MGNRILVVGTYDTKDDEVGYLAACIRGQGGEVVTMDVSVLGDPSEATDHSNEMVVNQIRRRKGEVEPKPGPRSAPHAQTRTKPFERHPFDR